MGVQTVSVERFDWSRVFRTVRILPVSGHWFVAKAGRPVYGSARSTSSLSAFSAYRVTDRRTDSSETMVHLAMLGIAMNRPD